mmetsp:Transcript_38782/g.84655  ORF Transcript_38782/g.84655 Transcript_38782/m.84655 type:complete len:203 (-) Transcript_38782:692-1300(-)
MMIAGADPLVEQLPEHSLNLRRASKEKLHRSREELKFHIRGLSVKVLNHGLQEVGGVVKLFAVLSHNPKHCAASLRLRDQAHALGDHLDHLAIVLPILSEQVLHGNKGLSADVVNFQVQELQQGGDDMVRRIREPHSNGADGTNRLPRDLCINIRNVLAHLLDNRLHGFLCCQACEDLQLDDLDIGGIIVSTEKLLEISLHD